MLGLRLNTVLGTLWVHGKLRFRELSPTEAFQKGDCGSALSKDKNFLTEEPWPVGRTYIGLEVAKAKKGPVYLRPVGTHKG